MKPRTHRPESLELRAFVDALREWLGLDPLYLDPTHRATMPERFGRLPMYADGYADPNGNRRVPSFEARSD